MIQSQTIPATQVVPRAPWQILAAALESSEALNLLPFAALVDEHGEYLAQHFEITYLTSGRDLLRMAAESPARGSVVVADPNYGPSASGGAPVDSNLQLHMATHGFFLNDQEVALVFKRVAGFGPETVPLPLGENPLLRSGLALAGANARRSGTTDDGILTAAEAAQLDLLGTQLVVLSACETGVGTVQTGEGVYGLRRALVLAGAQAQLASLWKVADAATQELMLDYYQRLLKGEGRSGALLASQQAMMANPARQHPYYWAAFIPIGNWTPMTPER